VVQVRDEPEVQPLVDQGGSGHAWLAVPDGPLRVEQVGHHAGPRPCRLMDLRAGRIGVPEARHDAGGIEPRNGIESTRSLGRQCHQRHRGMGDEAVDVDRTRIGHQLGTMSALASLGDERSLDVGTEDSRAGPVLGVADAVEGGQEFVDGRRDDRGQAPGGAGAGQRRQRGGEVGAVCHGEVHACEAVDLQVQEPGREEAAWQLLVHRLAGRIRLHHHHAAVSGDDAAVVEEPRSVEESGGVQHGPIVSSPRDPDSPVTAPIILDSRQEV
jgi:hypothetical protein